MSFIRLAWAYANLWRDLYVIMKGSEFRGHPKLFSDARGGSLKPTDALIVGRLLERHKPLCILEIGSFLGLSTRFLLDATAPCGSKVTAVDPNIKHRIFSEPRRFVEKLNQRHIPGRLEIVTAFFGKPHGISPGSVPVIGPEWGRKFDCIFIDGDHSYDAVSENFRLAVGMLEQGGCILFHDPLSWPEVGRFIDEIKEEYRGRADVAIYGRFDQTMLRLIGRKNDGIGYFRLR